MTEPGTFDPRTPVFGIFECWKCQAQRPILVPAVEYRVKRGGGGERAFRCRVCNTKSNVKWLDKHITFQAYLNQLPKEES
jgi:hypothetical protein